MLNLASMELIGHDAKGDQFVGEGDQIYLIDDRIKSGSVLDGMIGGKDPKCTKF